MTHLTAEQLQTARAALEAERATLQTDLSEHGAKESDGVWAPSSSGLSGEEADASDAADQIEELVTNVPLEHDLASRMHDVSDALQKIADGTYGICEVSGEEIPFDRLIADPAARTCIDHA
jgi:RNA polymerase-binding transcription factor DksA